MRAVTALLIGLITLFSISAHSADGTSALVNLHQIGGSKIKGAVTLSQGPMLTQVTGAARGLDPFTPYVSLVYDLSTVPGGPNACHPQTPTPPIVLGFWEVNPDGTASLNVQIPGLNVNEIGTMSIRIFTPEPPRPLQACGRVNVLF